MYNMCSVWLNEYSKWLVICRPQPQFRLPYKKICLLSLITATLHILHTHTQYVYHITERRPYIRIILTHTQYGYDIMRTQVTHPYGHTHRYQITHYTKSRTTPHTSITLPHTTSCPHTTTTLSHTTTHHYLPPHHPFTTPHLDPGIISARQGVPSVTDLSIVDLIPSADTHVPTAVNCATRSRDTCADCRKLCHTEQRRTCRLL